MNKLSSYSIDRDYGFAPNPFWNFCTLATCKPIIRGNANIGDYVIGFGGKNTGKLRKLIYLMKVEEKMTFEEYWNDARFQIKKPNIFGSLKVQYGDNIYHKNEDGKWIQENSHHSRGERPNASNRNTDTQYDQVLISEKEWWYFGDQAIQLPPEFDKYIHKRGHKNFPLDADFHCLLDYLCKNYPNKGRIGLPNQWAAIKKAAEKNEK